MQRACSQWGGAAAAVVFALLLATPLRAADNSGMRPVAEELGQRTKPAAAPEGEQKGGGLSDSAVRVLMTYALSIIPDTYTGPDGKPIKIDKSDPNKFVIPVEDARRIVRVATRSAYAQVCELQDLERANFQTLMKSEEAKKVWSKDQMFLINALHIFSVSYFTGNIKITTTDGARRRRGQAACEGREPRRSRQERAARRGGGPARHRDRGHRPEAADLLARAEGQGDERDQRLCGGQCRRPRPRHKRPRRPRRPSLPRPRRLRRPRRPTAAPIDTFRHSRVESGAKLKPVRL